MCHMSCVTCHVSPVMCHKSQVKKNCIKKLVLKIYHAKKIEYSGEASRWRFFFILLQVTWIYSYISKSQNYVLFSFFFLNVLNVWIFCFNVPFRRFSYSYSCFWFLDFKQSNICCTLRSGLHEIPTIMKTFPHGLENNHSCKWISNNFPGMLTYLLILKNCLKSICMHCCSPVHVESSTSS